MTIFSALMFAFNTMIFSDDVPRMLESIPFFSMMLLMATTFIIFIISWLINYMVRFMLEKRSREFGIYLLIGLKKKQISQLFLRENMIIGCFAFVLGIVLGVFLQQVLLTIFYSMMSMKNKLQIELNPFCLLMTIGCYFGCYALALFGARRRLKKINIHGLMNLERENQQVSDSGAKWKQCLFFVAVIYLVVFNLIIFNGWAEGAVIPCLILGFIVAVYMLYYGLSAFIFSYIRSKRNGIYKGSNLFLLRQFSGKVKTMYFTFGTLTLLFAFALAGCSGAMMFNDYLSNQLEESFPFDISVHSLTPDYDFSNEIQLVKNEVDIKNQLIYTIIHNLLWI
jgi:hypothetical protein